MPNANPLKIFITFVAICLKYFSVFLHFSLYSVSAHAQNMGKFQMFEIFLTILYQFMVAEYFHKFYIFQKSCFKENCHFAVSYCFQ